MFRFTMRDVLWLTTVLGLMLAWWVSRQWAEPPPPATTSYKIILRLGQNHFEADGPAEIVKEHFGTFLQTIYPPPPMPLESADGSAEAPAVP
jgi:hypothetical protein